MARDRVLIVTHAYAPQQNPRALRWSSIAKYWGLQGISVDVVTASGREGIEPEAVDGVTVYPTGENFIDLIRSRFAKRAISDTSNSGASRHTSSLPKRMLRMVHDYSWKQLYWPDYACLWIGPATRKIRSLLCQHDYTAVISVSDPYSGHLATLNALKRANPTRWLVDIGDPFSARDLATPNNLRLYKARNRRLETEILSLSSAITVTTQGTADEYVRHFPDAAGKVRVIGPLMTEVAGVGDSGLKPTSRTGKKLVYVGTLYAELRSPASLLEIFGKLVTRTGFEKTELHFYGGTVGSKTFFERYRALFGKNLFLHGVQPRDAVLKAMSDADILVNIGNRSKVQLPSKVVEYIWAGKPIWNLGCVAGDTSAAYLAGYPALLNQMSSESTVGDCDVNQVAEFVKQAPFRIPEEKLGKWKERSNITTIADQYAKLCFLNATRTSNAELDMSIRPSRERFVTIG